MEQSVCLRLEAVVGAVDGVDNLRWVDRIAACRTLSALYLECPHRDAPAYFPRISHITRANSAHLSTRVVDNRRRLWTLCTPHMSEHLRRIGSHPYIRQHRHFGDHIWAVGYVGFGSFDSMCIAARGCSQAGRDRGGNPLPSKSVNTWIGRYVGCDESFAAPYMGCGKMAGRDGLWQWRVELSTDGVQCAGFRKVCTPASIQQLTANHQPPKTRRRRSSALMMRNCIRTE